MNKKAVIVAAISLASLGLLLVLSVLSKQSAYFPLDLIITRFLQWHRSSFLDTFFGLVSWPGYPPQVEYIAPAIVVVLAVKRWFKEAFWQGVGTFLASVVVYAFKVWVDRPRVSEGVIDFVVHKGLEGGKHSFPAGHVQSYVILLGFLAIVLFLKMKKSWLRRIFIGGCVFMIVFIGPSRVYLGEHWTSDVIGAYLLGVFVLGLVYTGYSFTTNAKKQIAS